jgi:Fe-S-cluster containining protein
MSKNARYECTGCGNCCRWEGHVHVTQREIEAIAEYLGIELEEFLERYTELTRNRQGLSLIDQENGACFFLTEDNRCRIQPVKPQQCRDFPNDWSFPGFEQRCNARKINEAPESGA